MADEKGKESTRYKLQAKAGAGRYSTRQYGRQKGERPHLAWEGRVSLSVRGHLGSDLKVEKVLATGRLREHQYRSC